MNRNVVLTLMASAAAFLVFGLLAGAGQEGATTAVIRDSETSTPTPSPTLCPMATPEPLWVEPVISPTGLLTQTITVRIGNGEAVTVTAESGVYPVTGSFDAYAHPALVPIALSPNTVNHLAVEARVRQILQWGCIYGDYILRTQWDRYGSPLVIVQEQPTVTPTPPLMRHYLPILLAMAAESHP